MGVSIHYRGRLDDSARLASLCDEVGDIAHSMGCPSATLDDDWSTPPDATLTRGGKVQGHLGLKGIQITPHPAAWETGRDCRQTRLQIGSSGRF